jgi:hypothetical protein
LRKLDATAPGHDDGEHQQHHIHSDHWRFFAPSVHRGRTGHHQGEPDRSERYQSARTIAIIHSARFIQTS